MPLPWRSVTLCIAAMLAACDERSERTADTVAPSTEAAAPPSATQAEKPFFVGRWAAREDLCREGAWVFTESGVSTAGEVSCTFDTARRVAAGYQIAATCTAHAPAKPYEIRLSYAESAQALLVEGGPFADIGLIACPAD
jgi:hypothetical protein